MNVLVMGRAKTGTTIIAKTIQKSITNASFLMEPKTVDRFKMNYEGSLVAKIIFEHWSDKPDSRLALINNELATKFDKCILIIRDPRDELISRMFYIAYGYIKQNLITREQLAPWLDIVKEKELNPDVVSVLDMMAVLNQLLGIHMNLELKNTFDYFSFLKNQVRMKKAEMNVNRIFILRYEDFITNKLQELEGHLDLTLSKERTVGQFNNRIRRTSSFDNWKSFFLKADLDAFKALHYQDMEVMGYRDWEIADTPKLDPEHGSIYLARLLDEAESLRNKTQPAS